MIAQTAETRSQRLQLRGLDWDRYRRIADALEGRHVRLTYDRGNLEFMTISAAHAPLSRLLAQFVVVLTEELGLPRRSFGDMTCGREDLDRGLEPDECFYVANEAVVRGRDEIDLTVDPPPDLAIEVDISPPGRNRPAIYAALGVPELWRFDGETLTMSILAPDGRYAIVERSRCIPPVRPADLGAFLARRHGTDEASLVREFRTWARSLAAARQPDDREGASE